MIEKHLHWVSKRTLAGFGQTHLTNSLYLYYFMCTYIFWVFLKIVGKSISGDVFMNMCVCVWACLCVITSLPLSSLCQCVCVTEDGMLHNSSLATKTFGETFLLSGEATRCWLPHMLSNLDFIGLWGFPEFYIHSVFERIQKWGPCLHNEVSAPTSRGFGSLPYPLTRRTTLGTLLNFCYLNPKSDDSRSSA